MTALSVIEPATARPMAEIPRAGVEETDAAVAKAKDIWRTINLVNLHDNVAPTRPRANLVLSKGADHRIETVALRKL